MSEQQGNIAVPLGPMFIAFRRVHVDTGKPYGIVMVHTYRDHNEGIAAVRRMENPSVGKPAVVIVGTGIATAR